jgi:hypothetical protein
VVSFDIVMPHTSRADITKLVISKIPITYRIILVDNSPYHEMKHLIAFRDNFLWLKQSFPSSVASALNLGIRHAETEWVLLTSNDMLYNPRTFLRAEERFKDLTEKVKAVLSREGHGGLYHVPTIKEIGGFDENLPLRFGENMDFLYRLCLAGHYWGRSDHLAGLHVEGGRHTMQRDEEVWAPEVPEENRTTVYKKWSWKYLRDRKPVIVNKRLF